MSKKILIIDDEKDFVGVLQKALERDYQVLTAFDGEEGLKKALETKPDLVICDVVMPKLTGTELLNVVRTTFKTKDIPFIMLTAVDEADITQRAADLAVTKYVLKPVVLEELLPLVKKYAK